MGALKYWIWLTNLTKTAGTQAYVLLRQFGTPEAAYAADEAAYARLALSPQVREGLTQKSLAPAEQILRRCEALKIRVLTLQDTEYPERLRQLEEPPCVLYVKGQLPQMDEELSIAVVGAREASPYGEVAARRFSGELARQGAVIVSGIARGIDAAAITGALTAGGRVVSVLGNGIDVPYPKSSTGLYEDVSAMGALVTEYPPGTKPEASHFPVRNRIISGLALGTLVVEGGEQSGSLITARLALEQNRDVFAVPGNYNSPLSAAPNLLIQRGEAKLVRKAWDILEEYQYSYPHKIQTSPPPRTRPEPEPVKEHEKPARRPEPAAAPAEERVLDLQKEPELVTDDERAILKAMAGRLCTADELIEATGIPAKRVLSSLTMLQVRAFVEETAGKRFRTSVTWKESKGSGQAARPWK